MAEIISDARALDEFVRMGRREALEIIVRRYVDVVHSAARRIVRDDHLAEDVTQAVFIVLMKKAAGVDARMLPGWLVKTARLAAKEAIRARETREKYESRAGEMKTQMVASEERVDEEIVPLLDDAMSQLNPVDRTVVVMRFLQRASFAAVGAAMGFSEEAARKRVGRAVEKLRSLLRRQGAVFSVDGLLVVMAAQIARPAPAIVVDAVLRSLSSEGSGMAMELAKRVISIMRLIRMGLVGGALAVLVIITGGVLLAVENIGGTSSQPTVVPAARVAASQPTTAATQPVTMVRLIFVPGQQRDVADWGRLMPFEKGIPIQFMEARVPLGGRFPVQDAAGVTLFNVRMITGDDNHVVLNVRDKTVSQRIDLPRGEKGITLHLAGGDYTINYPSIETAATGEKDQKRTTDKATIMVFH